MGPQAVRGRTSERPVSMATSADDLQQTILDNAVKPASASVDGISVTQHSLRDQLEVLRHARGATAADRNHLGLRFVKLTPPGAG